MPSVLAERAGEVALVRLNRPQRLNAINEDIRRELPPALAALNADSALRAVVHAGAGERAFSSGQDLDEAARRFQRLAYESGEPQRLFKELSERKAS